MNRTLALAALGGVVGYFAWTWWQRQRRARFTNALGARTYDSLNALAPTITAPVIRVPVPTLLI